MLKGFQFRSTKELSAAVPGRASACAAGLWKPHPQTHFLGNKEAGDSVLQRGTRGCLHSSPPKAWLFLARLGQALPCVLLLELGFL